MAIEILPSITTTNHDITDIQLNELEYIHLDKAGLFLTGLPTSEERMNLLHLIHSKFPHMEFPLVHIRVDSSAEEAEFCINKLNTKWMNVHGDHYKKFKETPLMKYKKFIIAENSKQLKPKHMENYSGICLDLSHYYEDIINNKNYVGEIELTIQKFAIQCNHISAIKTHGDDLWAEHSANYKEDFSYLQHIPIEYFGICCSCLELENTIESQIEYVDYIKELLSL